MKAVQTLGKFRFEERVSERTSHVVASGPRRTINMLRAISRGCWVLRDEWVILHSDINISFNVVM